MDVLLPSLALIARLGRIEQHLKGMGLHAQAQGVRDAITLVIRMAQEAPEPSPPLEPSP